MTCLTTNTAFLTVLATAGVLALGFRWGWARAVTKYEHVRQLLATPPTPNVRRTPCPTMKSGKSSTSASMNF